MTFRSNKLYRITPLEKKSIRYNIETYQLDENNKYVRGFTASFLYRWGQGFREEDNLPWQYEIDQGVSCDPTLGWGSELDDLISVYVDFDGDWDDDEMDKVRAFCEGEEEDEEGRCCESWIFDGDHKFEIEIDEIIIDGPVKIDLVDETQYNVVIEENIEPYKNEVNDE